MNNKIIYGFKNIFIAKDGEIPTPIQGAISVRIDIEYNKEYCYVGNKRIAFTGRQLATGELEVLGLSKEEKQMLLGYRIDRNGGQIIDDSSNAPLLHLLFSRQVADGSNELYHVFNVRFSRYSLEGNTIQEDEWDNETIILQMDIDYDDEYKGFYYVINDSLKNNTTNNWFNELQYPAI